MDAVEESEGARRLRLRYPAVCSACGTALAPGTEAYWDKGAKRATCVTCVEGNDLSARLASEAGRSAHAKAEQLESRAVDQARQKWGPEAAAVAAKIAADDPSVLAWEKGSSGESRLAAFIKRELGESVLCLHDRLIPGRRAANIDHIFVAPSGVWVVDAKTYAGKMERRDAGPFWRVESQIYVKGRNRTKLVDGMEVQVKAVRAALEPDPLSDRLSVYPALCFIDTEWALFARPYDVRGVTVLYPGALRDRLRKPGSLDSDVMRRIATRLALALPPA